MSEVPIKPKKRFSFISLPRRDLSERAQLLDNFDGVPPPNNDVVFYKLLRSPSDDPPEGGDSGDRVEVWGANDYRTRVNEIARRVLGISRQPSTEFAAARKEWLQYLNVIEFGGGIRQALKCLSDDGFHFKDLVSPEAVEVSEDRSIPPFGVFLKGDFRAGNSQDPERSVLVVRIPYLGSPVSRQSSETQESWSLSKFISQSVTGLRVYPLDDDELSVHQAIFVVLNNAVVMVSKSKEDEGARMVFPQQDRAGAFHVLVHMVSETLNSGDRSILASLESQATLFEIQSLLPNDGSSTGVARKVLGRITAIKTLVAEQTAILEDLKGIFGRAVPDFKHPSIYSNKYTKNMLRVPVISGPADGTGSPAERSRGQMSYVAATLETIIEERRQFRSKGVGVYETIQKAQTAVATNSQSEQLQAQTLLFQERQAQAQALQEEIKIQGKTLSVFTVVNVLFLPLYFSTSGDSLRNGAIGTSMELFWAVTAPITLFIALIALYFVLESQYELRQFGRLFVDALKLKGWKWPITKAGANSQRNYLRRLRKYRVLAVPVGSGEESQSGIYYLTRPEAVRDSGGDELPLRVENAAYAAGEFRFDEENGWLFRDEVDEFDYMYYAHVGSPTVPPGGESLPLNWKRSRMVMEKEPYRFKGAFQEEQRDPEKFLRWVFCSERGTRWDTKDIVRASDFAVEYDGQDYMLRVRGPGSNNGNLYRLKLIPVAAKTL